MVQSKISIFSCERPEQYFSLLFAEKKEQRLGYSLRQFARFLGFSDSGSLSRIMNGKRSLSIPRAQKMAAHLELNPDELLYFYQMILLQDVKDQIRLPLLQSLRSILTKMAKDESIGSEEQFNSIANYQYLAVRECLRLKRGKELKNLSKIWRAGLAPDFENIFKSLEDLELISKDSDGFKIQDPRPFVFSPEKKSEAIRHYHSGWLDVAIHALHQLATEERSFQGTTLAIPGWAYEEVVRRVTHLHQDILKLSIIEDADQVIHFGSFVVPVTNKGEESVVENGL